MLAFDNGNGAFARAVEFGANGRPQTGRRDVRGLPVFDHDGHVRTPPG
jgi:hypothetical protein